MAPLCRESLSSTVLQLNPKALIYLEWVWDWVACLWSNWKQFNYILWLNHSWVLAIRYQTGNRVIRKLQDVSMGGFTSPAQPGQLCLQPPPHRVWGQVGEPLLQKEPVFFADWSQEQGTKPRLLTRGTALVSAGHVETGRTGCCRSSAQVKKPFAVTRDWLAISMLCLWAGLKAAVYGCWAPWGEAPAAELARVS